MIKFYCKGDLDNAEKAWQGYISKLTYFGSHMEISVLLAEHVTVDICRALSGFFAYFPYYETGLNLSSLFNTGENAGKLMAIFSVKDAVTVAHAIGKVGNLLSKPRRGRRPPITTPDEDELPF